jgi:hypothetical protein
MWITLRRWKQVLAEAARRARRRFQVLVGGGDDAHVDADRLSGRRRDRTRPRPARAAGASAGRVTCRRSRRGTACRYAACSKRPMRRAVGAGKGAALMPEELGLEQLRAAIAVVFSATNGCLAERGLCSCSARATSSLPVPDSPVMSTVMLERDRRPMVRNTSCMAGALVRSSAASPRRSDSTFTDPKSVHRPARHGAHEGISIVHVERLWQILESAAAGRPRPRCPGQYGR